MERKESECESQRTTKHLRKNQGTCQERRGKYGKKTRESCIVDPMGSSEFTKECLARNF
jgi:hypothetical protein